ncbi:hypothetical protein HHK36_000207 [Tetracentron sinense]|uniref:DUF4378 domain-containing protein n=1 Tax=Tetracentron sinense TaxID=13715 RepID=A0A835DTS7_TETSI|nr:hypothetical protein HHK36_000207 [Tetracentron sinense]
MSKESDKPQASNKIVVLKPGPAGIRNFETETSFSSSPQSHYSLRNEGQSMRVTSQFSFTEIKRKLKHVMGKERHSISMDGILHRIPYERQDPRDSGKGIEGDTVGRDSPSKTYFQVERTAKPFIGVKKRDEIGKSKDCEPNIGHEVASTSIDGYKNLKVKTVGYPKQSESNIYIEAKRHLSEILRTEDEDEHLSSKQVPITLGRILSLPEYMSPKFSPVRDGENSFVTAQMRFSPYENFPVIGENMWRLKQENNAGLLSPLRQNLEAPSCIDGDKFEDKLQVFESNSDISKEVFPVAEIPESIYSVRDDLSPEGDVEIVQIAHIVCPEDQDNLLNVSSEPNKTPITSTNKSADTAKICEERGYSECSRLESSEEIQPPSSSLRTCYSSSLIIHKVENLESINEPSPVSVLEPFFIDDIISPASTISQPVNPPMQPLRIQFEENDTSTSTLVVTSSNPEIYLGTCMEDKKSAFEYVRAVLRASGLSWEELLGRWLSSGQLLDLPLFNEVDDLSSQFWCDRKVLFDCINEVLVDLCERYFGCSPCVSFVKPNIRPVPVGKNIVREVWEGIDWHLLPLTLDQIVGKDLENFGTWMDLRFDTEDIGIDMEEAILEELMKDIIFELCYENPNIISMDFSGFHTTEGNNSNSL